MIPRSEFFDKARPWFWSGLLLLGNMLVVCGTELAYDEAYYWLFSQHLDWGYFDHPPMAALWIAATAWLPGEIGVRLGYVLGIQGAAWLLSSMAPAERRWQVWAGFSLFPLLAYAGVFAIPDGPLVCLSVVWLWALWRGLKEDNLRNAVLIGVASALLLYSKYHGVLYMVGTIIALPKLLKRPTLWLALLIAVVLFLPHVYWQWQHGFATLRYHFIERPKVPFGLESPALFVLTQLFLFGLFLGPAFWYWLWNNKPSSDFDRALKVIALFIPAFFLLSSFNKKVEANWTVAVGLPMLLYLVRENAIPLQKAWVRRLGWASVSLLFVSRLVLIVPPQGALFKRGGELHGWAEWAKTIQEKAGPDCPLMANRYQIASKLSFYLKQDVPALNVGTRLNQFEFWDWEKAAQGKRVCWVTQITSYPGEPVPTPDGKGLILVKQYLLDDILAAKTRSL